ncbi:MAG: hypothetical protein Tsb0020_44380 [Haliangiales bacterium]
MLLELEELASGVHLPSRELGPLDALCRREGKIAVELAQTLLDGSVLAGKVNELLLVFTLWGRYWHGRSF